jgi:hypothetical protein
MIKSFASIGCRLALISWVTLLVTGVCGHCKEPIRVAIFPFEFHAKESLDYLQDAIFVTLSGRLIGEPTIEIVDRGAVRDALASRGPTDRVEKVAPQVADGLDADYAIVGHLTKVGEVVDLDARLINVAASGPPLSEVTRYQSLEAAMEGLGHFADRVRRRIVLTTEPGEEQERPDKSSLASLYDKVVEGIRGERPTPPQPAGGLEILETLPTFLRGVDAGDVDGDKQNEVVLMDKRTLWIYKQRGARLRLFRKIQGHKNDDFLTLDVADVNRNGLSEIMVSNMRAGMLRSFILEFEDKMIKKISDREKWFFRVVQDPGMGETLVGQKIGVNREPIGGIHRLVWNGKTFEPEKKPVVKKDVAVFGFNMGDVEGRGEASVLYTGYHERIHVLDMNGAYRWESSVAYGGSDIYYSLGSGGEAGEKRVYLPARLLARDLDRNGTAEVMVSQNTFKLDLVKRLRMYDTGRLVSLSWQGLGFAESWATPEISGYISDYQIRDIDNDGRDEIVLTAVSKGTLRSGASSSLLLYELD